MSENAPNAKGPAPVQLTPEATEPVLIPADQVKPEDWGILSIEYRDGQPQLVVSGGKYIPAGMTVVDADGNPLFGHKAGGSTAFLSMGDAIDFGPASLALQLTNSPR